MNRNRRIPLLGRFFIGTGRLINLLLWWLILFVVVRGLLYLSPDLNQTQFAHYVSLVVEPATSRLEELFKHFGIKPVIRETNILLPSLFLLLLSVRSLLKRGVNQLKFYLTSSRKKQLDQACRKSIKCRTPHRSSTRGRRAAGSPETIQRSPKTTRKHPPGINVFVPRRRGLHGAQKGSRSLRS